MGAVRNDDYSALWFMASNPLTNKKPQRVVEAVHSLFYLAESCGIRFSLRAPRSAAGTRDVGRLSARIAFE